MLPVDIGKITDRGVHLGSEPDEALSQETAEGGYPPERPWWTRWPALALLPVLLVQAFLSLRLTHANTAFQDEAAYIWAGHREWAHLLHGAPVPHFAAYFSGAPVIYPPIGALAESVGGLAAARTCPCSSCSGPPPCCGPRHIPAVRAAGRVLRRGAVRGRARRCTWGRSPPTTPWRCSLWRWPPGAWSGPGTAVTPGWLLARRGRAGGG